MESCSTQAVLPLVGLATEKVIRARYSTLGGLARPLGMQTGRPEEESTC
ncbi:MAG: hypothetical protein R6U98_26080 [Pirellulaceae bacterium]